MNRGMIRPLRKKSAVRIGVLSHPYDESRRTPAVAAASLSVPPVLVARMGGRKAAVSRKGCTVRQPCSSYLLGLASKEVVFTNRTPWRPHMARIPTSPLIAVTNVVNAINNLSDHFTAFEAIEQMLSPQKAGTKEDLAHVDRASLGFLLTMLNVTMREQITVARAAAQLAHRMNGGTA